MNDEMNGPTEEEIQEARIDQQIEDEMNGITDEQREEEAEIEWQIERLMNDEGEPR
jgi:hypothetical protein